MKFEDALKAMREGKKAKLQDGTYYLKDGDIRVDWATGEKQYPLALVADEVLSEDWELVEE